jgi:AcrR family transcriptional regulator
MAQSKRITSRQAQAIKTRNKILKTTIDLMQKKGFDNITIETISKKAGVSVGSFYYYFKSFIRRTIIFKPTSMTA